MRDDPQPDPDAVGTARGSPPAGAGRPLVIEVDRAFRELFSAVDTALDAAAAHLGINRTDLRCLEVLDRLGPLPAGALAEAVALSAAAVTKIVDRLVALGYVERSRDPVDRRRVVVQTTDLERARRREVFMPLVVDGMRLLAEHTDDDLRLLRSVLDRSTALNRAHVARLTGPPDAPPLTGPDGDYPNRSSPHASA
jgi:DNA-binding MarR family transcriptional regulator